jgi:hypothetical protein
MSAEKKDIKAEDAIKLSLREKKTVEICDVDGTQELVLETACDTSCVNDSTTDFWGMREGDTWHVCVLNGSHQK